MLYWNLERELVDGEPLFFGQTNQFHQPNLPKATGGKIYSAISSKAQFATVGSTEYQRKDI